MYRVVFDTNVLISATISKKGKPHRCLRLAEAGKIQSITCAQILEEFQEKLQSKFEHSADRAGAVISEIKRFSEMVTITGTVKVIAADPDDDKILECAVAGKASHIVSGDKRHVLVLGSYQEIAIVSAAEFLRNISEQELS